MSLLSQGGRSGGRRGEGGEGSAVLLGCLWSGFHHAVFDQLPGADTAAEVRASGPGDRLILEPRLFSIDIRAAISGAAM